MELNTIIKANLKSKKGNFISIFVLVFIIALALSTIISVSIGSNKRVITACKNSNISDITTFIKQDKLTDEMLQKIRTSDKVDSVTLKKMINSSLFEVNGKKYGSIVLFTKYNPTENPYEMYTQDGIGLSKDKTTKPQKGEIYLPIAMENLLNCKLGDKVTINTTDGEMKLTITKFFEDPFIGSSMIGAKILLISDEDFESIYNNPSEGKIVQYAVANVSLKKEFKNQQSQIIKELNETSGIIDAGTYSLTLQASNNYMTLFINIINGILCAVAILLYIVVLIIIGHSVSTSIDMDYVSFGILKSQGFTSTQIRCSIMLQYLLAGVTGGVAGILVSTVIIKYVNAIFIPVTGLCPGNGLMLLETISVIAGLLLIIALYVIVKTKKVISISPMQAIASGRGPVYFSERANISVINNIPVSINAKLIVKQVAGDWTKYVTTVLIMALLVFFTMSITSIKQITTSNNLSVIFGGYSSDISVKYNNEGQGIVASIKKDIEEKTRIEKEFSIGGRYLSIDSNEILCRVLDKTETANPTLKGRVPKYDNEVMITQMTSKNIGKKIGDKVKLKYDDVEYEYIIVGTYQDTSDVGISIALLESGFKHLDPDFKYSKTEYVISDKKLASSIVGELKEKYASYIAESKIVITDEYKKGQEDDNTILTAVDSITAITYFLAFLFAAIVSFMICQKNFSREQSDMGVYKSVGFTTGSLRRQFTIKYILVVMFGAAIGVVVSLILNDSVVSLLLSGMGITRFVTQYSFVLLFGPALFIVLCTAIFAWFVSVKIKKVSPKNLINE
ncbi:ABC transporter permease [[Clostridium] fimetarium]|uniref:ABC-type transport system, involved in lipoprotein release, permease component n=1 Tax=[Clostridium] fimetarium TaxID=99656 RepID=A0A1I0R9G9_9FIRM|nr:FtsX-like permease family protein [[Clostridium] fimetarium]SEW36844.1 ABC-type transport system, involved in lipoprotein release, permease component [[Clostridium] fimetarium]